MKIILCDINPVLCSQWDAAFIGWSDVTVVRGHFAQAEAEAIVSPANSFGFMDGGIDAAYVRQFGSEIQEKVQIRIRRLPYPELLVGQALSVSIPAVQAFRFLIVAPTMRTPRVIVDADAVRLATRAAVAEAQALGVKSVLLPGMGAGSGRVPETVCADQMERGASDVLFPRSFPESWQQAASQ